MLGQCAVLCPFFGYLSDHTEDNQQEKTHSSTLDVSKIYNNLR